VLTIIHEEVAVENVVVGYCPVEFVAVAGQPPVEHTCDLTFRQNKIIVSVKIFFKT
jgi:hypothetical protein